MVRAKERGKWNAVGWLTKGTLAAVFCSVSRAEQPALAQETSWQDQLDDGKNFENKDATQRRRRSIIRAGRSGKIWT